MNINFIMDILENPQEFTRDQRKIAINLVMEILDRVNTVKGEVMTYTTKDEVKFIRNIGTHANIPKRKALEGYLRGWERRTNWGGIDKFVALTVARSELNLL